MSGACASKVQSTGHRLRRRRRIGVDPDLLLREGDREAGLAERAVDGDAELALDHAEAVETVRPRPELKLQRAVTEAQEERQRRRRRDYIGMALRHLGEHL